MAPITAKKLPLNWVRTGPKSAATVLLIHAVGCDLTYWDRQIEVLQANYKVVPFDRQAMAAPLVSRKIAALRNRC